MRTTHASQKVLTNLSCTDLESGEGRDDDVDKECIRIKDAKMLLEAIKCDTYETLEHS